MKWMGCRNYFIVVSIVSITAVLGVHIRAASQPPAVSIARNANLHDRVVPADFNGDGITDLAATDGNGYVIAVIGKGDGTFGAPTRSTVQGDVLATGDFNKDGKIDLIVSGAGNGPLYFLAGNGTGSFAAGVQVATTTALEATFAVSADYDGDGNRDLAVGFLAESGSDGVLVYPGRGDGTFGDPVTQLVSMFPLDGVTADLNGDGRKDIVVASHYGYAVWVFLNQGAFSFTAADVPMGNSANDVTVGDVDGDGKLDLVVALAGGGDGDNYFTEGYAAVLKGNGDGTFGAPVKYDVPRGAWRVVVGDFTRDGILDIATANRSSLYFDDCTYALKTWDSLSILPGNGDGTFAPASNFSIGDQANLDDPTTDRNRVTSLNTSDLNGDHATDLIASGGTLFLNRAATADRAPTVSLGPDQTVFGSTEVLLRAAAADPDDDMLTYQWSSNAGVSIPPVPTPCLSVPGYGTYTFTVTVDDGHGRQATDSVTITFTSHTGPGGTSYSGQDIGSVAAAGSDSFDGSVYTVSGSGADIWGTADEFHYVLQQVDADFDITTRVDSVQNANQWTKAGLMIRADLTAGAAHASIFATPGKGLAFQRRRTAGATSLNTSGPLDAAPVWVRLTRRGTTVRAYYRHAITDFWTLLGSDTIALSGPAYVGMAVTSHLDGTLATARFSNVALDVVGGSWFGAPIGGGSGSATNDTTIYTVNATGSDIWNSADQFYYVFQNWHGDGMITARVRSLTNTSSWAKAGVMFRDTLSAGSTHVDAIVSAAKGVAMQYRATTGGSSTQAGLIAGAAPGWVQLARHGDTFTARWSTDGTTWTTIGTTTVPMAVDIYVGLPVTSHNTSATATAAFDDVRLQP